MRKDDRAAALARIIRQFEKCRGELTVLHQELEAGSPDEPLDDIVALNAQMLESANRWLHVAYARLEREHTRAAKGKSGKNVPMRDLRVAVH